MKIVKEYDLFSDSVSVNTEEFNRSFELLWSLNDKESIKRVIQHSGYESSIIRIANDKQHIRNLKLNDIIDE
jgi:hypothetical protein